MNDHQYQKEYYAKNRETIRERARSRYKRTPAHRQSELAYKARHPERILEANRKSRLRNKFGISLDEYNKMTIAQDGKCAICEKTPAERNILTLYVDHNHNTGKIRKLLCRTCNSILGFCSEDKNILRRALAYLEGETR